MERRRTNKKKFWKPPGGKCESVGREAACRLIKFGAPGPVRGASFAFFFLLVKVGRNSGTKLKMEVGLPLSSDRQVRCFHLWSEPKALKRNKNYYNFLMIRFL